MLTSEKWHNFFPKSISGFEKWTKKMSKNEKPKYFWEKPLPFCDLTDPVLIWSCYVIFVTINAVAIKIIKVVAQHKD
jgi:hypothetical protein